MRGWTEKERGNVPRRYRNTERTSKTAPAALRGNIAVPESRNGLFRKKIYNFKSQVGKD